MSKKLDKKRIGRIFPILIFLLFLCCGMVISVLKPDEDYSKEENRLLQQAPEITVKSIKTGEFQKEYETYLSDQFIGRDRFVQIKSTLQYWLGKRDMNGVFFGTDGYLLEQYKKRDFDWQTMDDNAWFTADFLAAMQESYGQGHVYAMFVPSKGTVLQNRLPLFKKIYDTTYIVDYVKKYLKQDYDLSGDMVIDLTDTLKKHDEEYIFYRTDHHWTTLGAYYAYEKYKEINGQNPLGKEAYDIATVTEDFLGTTYDKVQVKTKADSITQWSLKEGDNAVSVIFDQGDIVWDTFYSKKELKNKDKYQYFLGGNTAQIHIHTQAQNKKTLLLLKDSYSNCFVEFLTPDYEDIYMIDLRYTNENIYDIIEGIEKNQPITDVLVMYNMEKFMKDSNLEQLEYQGEDLWEEEFEEEDAEDEQE